MPFLNGTNDFTFEQLVFNPPKPILQISFQLWFVNASGTVLFDNMTLQEQIPQQQYNCISPLVFNPDYQTNGDPICAIPCPVPVNLQLLTPF